MDKLLIFFLATLTAFGFSGVATIIYFFWLWSGFVKIEWTTLSSFTALLSYWIYGLTGLLFMAGSVLTMICALAMFWFDMSLQDIQEQAKETVNEARPEDQRQSIEQATDNEESIPTFTHYATEEFYKRSGLTEEQVQEYYSRFLTRYQTVSGMFDGVYNRVTGAMYRTRELTDEIPFIAVLYYYFDYVMNEIRTYIKAIISLKELSKLSRQGFGQTGPNGQPDFSALQNIDMGALLGGLEAFGLGQPPSNDASASDQNQNETQANRTVSSPASQASSVSTFQPAPSPAPFPFPMGGMGGMGGFDMAQMAELERNMTPQQKKQAEEAAMSMLQNMDMGQMGDMMKMFGMGNNMPNPQNLNRAQRKKLKKMQKKNK